MKIKILVMLIVTLALPIGAQVDSTYIKILEKDYQTFTSQMNEMMKQQEQLKGIIYYIEDKWKREKQKLDSLKIQAPVE